jgi:hypothetical protein
MKNLFNIFSLIMIHFAAQSEYLIKGKVINDLDQPIPYVNIGFVGTAIGTVSEESGDFALYLAEIPDKNLPLRFSCMGYEPLEMILKAETISNPIIVKLQRNTVSLPELVVKPGNLKTREYGNTSENTAMKTNLAISDKPNMNLGAEIGRKFRLSKAPNYISKLKFYVGYNNFDTLLIRVNFYEIISGKPANTLHQNPILRKVINHKTGWVTFDLEEEHIVLSGSIIASIEWIGASKHGNNFGLNISMPALFQTHYYKYGAQNKWKVFPNMSSSMVLIAESVNQ